MNTSTNEFKCETCDKTFDTRIKLKSHSVTHSEETPFECEICEKSFKRRRNLNQHMIVHAESVSYECSVCRTDIRRKGSLRQHMKDVHHLKGKNLKTAMAKSIKKKEAEEEAFFENQNEDDEAVEEENVVDTEKVKTETADGSAPGISATQGVEKEVKNEPIQEDEDVKPPKPQLQNISSKRRKLDSDEPSAKKVKVEGSDDSQETSSRQHLVEQENHKRLAKKVKVEDSEATSSQLNPVKQEVEPIQQQQEFQIGDFPNLVEANLMGPAPQPYQPIPSNFEEDARQISHQVLRVADDMTKERQDCLRRLMFATVFALEGAQTCTDVGEFFRMMGEQYAKK